MLNIAVLGSQWGDEGKGRVVHDFSPNYDWIVRFNGGANAGHTIYRDGKKYVHNLMPSFDWRSPRPKAFLGSGMVIDLQQLHKEVEALYTLSPDYSARVYVDLDAFLVLPEHKDEDKATNAHIGSTNRGIGPAYKSKISRCGVRIRDVMLGLYTDHDMPLLYEKIQSMGVKFVNLMDLTGEMLLSSILFEGSQGVLLDINHGIYPYVSCSESTVAGIYSSGFHFIKLDKVYGVAKCYVTKVGEGPFPTEILGVQAEELRSKGQEYGATTGRPRRVGWLDLPALNYACYKGGITDLIVTKFDILNNMSQINVCESYEKSPTCYHDFYNAKTNLISMSGWKDAKNYKDLSEIINKIEYATNRPVSYISCGVDKSDLIAW